MCWLPPLPWVSLSFNYGGQVKARGNCPMCEGLQMSWIKPVCSAVTVYILYELPLSRNDEPPTLIAYTSGPGTLLKIKQVSANENSYTWKQRKICPARVCPSCLVVIDVLTFWEQGVEGGKDIIQASFFPQEKQKRANGCICCAGIRRIVDVLFLWKLYYNF